MFIIMILLSCSRWSEAGRACSGEYWAEPEQNFSAAGGFNWNTFQDTCQSDIGCYIVEGSPVAPTIATGTFLQIVLIIFWAFMGCGFCMMCMMMMCMMMCMSMMMKKMNMNKMMMDMDKSTDNRGEQVAQTTSM